MVLKCLLCTRWQSVVSIKTTGSYFPKKILGIINLGIVHWSEFWRSILVDWWAACMRIKNDVFLKFTRGFFWTKRIGKTLKLIRAWQSNSPATRCATNSLQRFCLIIYGFSLAEIIFCIKGSMTATKMKRKTKLKIWI